MNKIIHSTYLSKIYGEKETSVTALDNISVEFNENEFTAIMGPSGSGKSTLLHCLAGLDRPTSGQIFLREQDISTLNDKQLTKINWFYGISWFRIGIKGEKLFVRRWKIYASSKYAIWKKF